MGVTVAGGSPRYSLSRAFRVPLRVWAVGSTTLWPPGGGRAASPRQPSGAHGGFALSGERSRRPPRRSHTASALRAAVCPRAQARNALAPGSTASQLAGCLLVGCLVAWLSTSAIIMIAAPTREPYR